MKRIKKFPLPEKFHSLVKGEAFRQGKTMSEYLREIAEDCEHRNISLRSQILNGAKNEKKKTKFVPRF